MSKKLSITSIGDTCVDIYPDQHKVFLGGTAFNVAYHAQKAGAQASIMSAVGKDTYGTIFLQAAKEKGIHTDHLRQLEGYTSTLQVPLDADGQPVFSEWKLGVLEDFWLSKEDELFLQTQDAARIILLKPLRKLFQSFYSMQLQHTFKVADFAGGSQYSVSVEEIEQYAQDLDMIVRSVGANCYSPFYTEELSFLKQIAKKYNKIVLASLGKEGSIIYTKDQEYIHPAIPTSVTDTTGAGDAYIAYFIVTYLQTKNIPQAMEVATKAAAKTVMHFGASQK